MSLPFHRGQTNMTYRGTSWGGKDKVDEANRSLMEQENDRKWVRKLYHFHLMMFTIYSTLTNLRRNLERKYQR